MCPICEEKVPKLQEHANARHLPWWADPLSACRICEASCNRGNRQTLHERLCHPAGGSTLQVDEWLEHMVPFFFQLAKRLKLGGIKSLLRFTREEKLSLESPPTLSEAERAYYEADFDGEAPPYNPCQPTSMRDLSHWKVLLRLVARAGIADEECRSFVPVHGFTFIRKPEDLPKPTPPASTEVKVTHFDRQRLGGTNRGAGSYRKRQWSSGKSVTAGQSIKFTGASEAWKQVNQQLVQDRKSGKSSSACSQRHEVVRRQDRRPRPYQQTTPRDVRRREAPVAARRMQDRRPHSTPAATCRICQMQYVSTASLISYPDVCTVCALRLEMRDMSKLVDQFEERYKRIEQLASAIQHPPSSSSGPLRH